MILSKIQEKQQQQDVRKYNIRIRDFIHKGLLGDALNAMEKMRQEEVMPDVVTYNTLVGGHVDKGQLNKHLK